LRLVAIFAALLTIAGVSSSLWGEPQSALVLQIAPSQNAIQPGSATWKTGAPVFFILTMKNNSQHVLHFALTNPAFNYRAKVLDSHGKPVPETENFRKFREALESGLSSTRNILVVLKPHETCQDTIEVSYLYDVVKPGEYTIQIERDMPPELGLGVVKSNVVKITVVE
jgi:hypothetical protein